MDLGGSKVTTNSFCGEERSASSSGSESQEGTDAPRPQASANASRGQGRKDLTKIVSFSAEQALS